MSQLREDIAILRDREREANRNLNGSTESGFMDDTPPRAVGVERYLSGS